MADLVREYRNAVSDPEIASLRATVDARDQRISQLEAKLVLIRFEVSQYQGGEITSHSALDGIHDVVFGTS